MKSSKLLMLPIMIMLVASLACNFATSIFPLNKTAAALALATTPPIQLTKSAEETVKRQATATPTATATATPTSTPNFKATSVVATQTAAVRQTEQALSMFEQVQKLQEDGYLSTSQGSWYEIDDFNESWAETTWYRWWNSGYQPIDFIIRANTEWWSASESSTWINAGCGFLFRTVDNNNRFGALFTLDGKARFDRMVNGEWRSPILSNAVPINSMNDQAQLMLVVEGNRFVFFRDGVEILNTIDNVLTSPKFQGGDLALTLMSGTNISFGTRCKLADIELWILR